MEYGYAITTDNGITYIVVDTRTPKELMEYLISDEFVPLKLKIAEEYLTTVKGQSYIAEVNTILVTYKKISSIEFMSKNQWKFSHKRIKVE